MIDATQYQRLAIEYLADLYGQVRVVQCNRPHTSVRLVAGESQECMWIVDKDGHPTYYCDPDGAVPDYAQRLALVREETAPMGKATDPYLAIGGGWNH